MATILIVGLIVFLAVATLSVVCLWCLCAAGGEADERAGRGDYKREEG